MVPQTPGSQQLHGELSFVATGQSLKFTLDPEGSVLGNWNIKTISVIMRYL